MADPQRSLWEDVDTLLASSPKPPADIELAPANLWGDVDRLLAAPPMAAAGGTVTSGPDDSDLRAFERDIVEQTRAKQRQPVPVQPGPIPNPVRPPVNANGITDPASVRVTQPGPPAAGWGVRPDGTQKGNGFLGPLARPDGGVMSEYSIADSEQLKDAKGNYIDYPTLVPTLTADEVQLLLNSKDGDAIPDSIKQKAEAFALQRKAAGLPLFAGPGEQQNLFPQFARQSNAAPATAAPAAAPPRLGSAKTGGMATATPGTMPVLDAPAEGVAQIGRGLPVVARSMAPGPVADVGGGAADAAGSLAGLVKPKLPMPSGKELKGGVSDVLEGVAKVSEPAMVAGATMAPISTAAAILAAGGAGAVADQGVRALGGSDEDARLAANIVQTAVGAYAGAKVHAGIRKGGAAARAARASGELPVAGELPGETGPVNVGAGRTAAAAERPPVTAERPPAAAVWDQVDQVLEQPPGQASAPGGPQAPVTVDSSQESAISGRKLSVPNAPVDESGRELGGYAGPERRKADAGPPEGVTERRHQELLDKAANNPHIEERHVEAAEAGKAAADTELPAPPDERRPLTADELDAWAERLDKAKMPLAAEDYRRRAREERAKEAGNAVSEPGAVAGSVQRPPGAGDEGPGGPVGPRDAGGVPESPEEGGRPEGAPAVPAVGEAPPDSGVTYFRSGASRPADFKGFADANVPVGVTATEVSGPLKEAIKEHLAKGGQVFVDSGAFGATPEKPVDFDKVLSLYHELAASGPQRQQLHVVAPDAVGNETQTSVLRARYGEELRTLVNQGVQVIVPVQKGNNTLATAIRNAMRQVPGAIIGIPSNKAAIQPAQVADALQYLTGKDRPAGIHLLGLGENRPGFDAAVATIRAAAPGIRISTDSNRVASMFVKGRGPQTKVDIRVETRAPERVDDAPESDTTELTGQLWRGELHAFTPKELDRLGNATGLSAKELRALEKQPERFRETLERHEQALDGVLHEIALDRAKRAEGPRARSEVITQEEGKPKKPSPPVKPKTDLDVHTALAKGFPNMPAERWRVENGAIVQTADPALGELGVSLRVTRQGDKIVVESTGPKKDKQIANFARARFEFLAKRYPAVREALTLKESHEPAEPNGPAAPSERSHEPGSEPEGGRDQGARGSGDQDGEVDTPVPTEDETLDTLRDQAVAAGWKGDPAQLRAELASRLALIKELDRQMADAGRDPVVLLKAIRDRGGINLKKETAWKGELKWLQEHAAGNLKQRARASAFGQVGPVQGVLRAKGRAGYSLDEMLQSLRADGRFNHLEDMNDLFEELRAAATYQRPGALVDRFVKGLGHEWWTRMPQALEPEAVEPAGDADISFNPDELEAPGQTSADKLDTGEEQPRLPAAGAARQVGKADTSFKAPVQASGDDFDLSAENEPEESDKQEPLFHPAKPLQAAGPNAKIAHPLPVRPAPIARPRTALQKVGAKLGLQPRRQAIPVAEIQKKLSELFRVPVGTRHFPQRAYGIYKPGVSAVRLGTEEDLQVLGHEMGHHLDIAIMQGSLVFNRGPIAKELQRVGAPTSLPSYDAKTKRMEGAAEFFRRWLTEPEPLQQEAPLYYAAFQQFLDHADPKLVNGLYEIQEDVQRYLSVGPLEQARLHVDFKGGSGSVLQVAQDIAAAAKNPEQRARAIAYLSSQWMDDLAYLKLAEQSIDNAAAIDAGTSAYVQARLARGYAAKAEGFLSYGVRDYDGRFLGRSLDDVLRPVYDRLHDFALYAAARRAQTLERRGKTSGFTMPQLQAVLEQYGKDEAFNAAIDGLAEFHKAKREYLVASGVISPEAAAKMAKVEPNYVPYERVREVVGAHLGGQKIANRASPVKRMKGSGRRIVNPLETIIKNTHAEVNSAETNLAMRKLVHAVTGPGSAEWLEEIPEPQVATRFNLQKLEGAIRGLLEDLGVEELPDGGTTLDEYLDQMVKVFTPRTFARGNERFVTVIDKGTLRWFEVHDHGLYDALTSIGPSGTAEIVRLFFRGARVLKSFATSTVGFIIRNPIKDQFSAVIQSRSGYRPTDFLRGLAEYLKAGEKFQLYLSSGADQANLVADDRDLLRKRLRQLGHSKTRKFLDDTLLNPLDGLRVLSAAGETATRLGEFMRSLKNEGEVSHRSLQIAALNARDVTQDFQKAGRQVRAWNQYTAFFSARVGGYGRIWEAAREDPKGFAWKALAAITLPSLALWVLNHDDAEYNEIPAWERSAYWHVPLPVFDWNVDLARLKAEPKSVLQGHGWIKIPKPFELGQVFGTGLEMFLDYLKGTDPNVASRLMDRTTAFQTAQQAIPTAVLPFIEVAANYDFFRDRSIVNPWQQDLAPELQYNRWTSETAKKLGELLEMSPAKIETIIYGYTAGVGQGVLGTIDPFLGGKKPAAGPGHWPGIGAIYRGPATSEAQSLQDLYTTKALLEGLTSSVKEWRAQGREDRAQKELAKYQHLAPYEQSVKQADAALKKWRTVANQVFDNPNLDPQQKREALDRLYLEMLNIARSALGRRPLDRKLPVPVAAR